MWFGLDKIAVRQSVKMRSTFALTHSREITKRFRERVSSGLICFFTVCWCKKRVRWHCIYLFDAVQLPYECIDANIVTDWYCRMWMCVRARALIATNRYRWLSIEWPIEWDTRGSLPHHICMSVCDSYWTDLYVFKLCLNDCCRCQWWSKN